MSREWLFLTHLVLQLSSGSQAAESQHVERENLVGRGADAVAAEKVDFETGQGSRQKKKKTERRSEGGHWA